MIDVLTKLPLFEPGGVCFLLGADNKVRAYHVSRREGDRYYLFRDGLSFPVRTDDARLRTGFETDFPAFDEIDWGRTGKPFIQQQPEQEIAELEANQAEAEREEVWGNWEAEDYSDRAEQWEKENAEYQAFLAWERFCFAELEELEPDQLELALMV